MDFDVTMESLRQEARSSLLQHYSSNTNAHATNILTITIGFFAAVEVLDVNSSLATSIIGSLWPSILVSVPFSFLGGLLIHQIIKFCWWAGLTHHAIYTPFPPSVLPNENLFRSLHVAVATKFRESARTVPRLHTYEIYLAALSSFIIFVILVLLQNL